MNEKSLQGEIVVEYLEKYSDMPTLSLAKLIYKENNSVYNSVETVRTRIRYYRGASGKEHKQKLKDRRFVRDIQMPNNPFSLPESDEKEFEQFVIPQQYEHALIFGDSHAPYHSVESLTKMIQYNKHQDIDCIILNGDNIDFHQLSVFIKDPRKRHFVDEINSMKRFLDAIQNAFPNVKLFYKYGNHEERYENYLRIKAPEMIGIKEFELDVLFGFGERFIDVIKDKRTIKFGKLNILHGHELKGGIIPPVNAARGVFLRTKENTLVNHFHTDSKHSEPSLSGNHISCWSIGCMCDLHPEYAVNNRWVHGFANVRKINKQGNFIVNTKQIIKGKIV